MATSIKISQLPVKGANLEATDLLEVSEFNGTGYVTKSITGQEIIDGASSTGVTAVTGTAPISSSGGTTPAISIATSNTTTTGALSSTDWNTFNGKQSALVSGTNIKTLNGASLLGSGGLSVEPSITAGTTSQYFRGDKTFQTLDKTAVGLSNVDNTSDANKPVSTSTQTALNLKQDTLTLTTIGTSGASTLVGSTLNIPQYSGGGSSNPSVVAVSVPDGTPITGSTLTISTSLLVPANTIATNSILQINWGIQRVSGATGVVINQIYINTSNTLTGATLVATGGNLGTTQTYVNQSRDIQKVGIVAKTSVTAQQVNDGSISTSINTFTLNNSVPLYFLFACQGGVQDVSVIRQVRITQYI